MVVFSVLSAFFALSETALLSIRRWQFQELAATDPRRAEGLKVLMRDPSEVVTVTTLWNTLANASLVFMGLWMALSKEWSLLPWTLGLFLYILLVCEVTPKTLAIANPVEWAARVTRPMSWVLNWSHPVCGRLRTAVDRTITHFVPASIKPNTSVTTADVREIVRLGGRHGALTEQESAMLLEIVDLDESVASDVMSPRSQLPGARFSATDAELVEIARRARSRRVILWGKEPDQVDGFLNTRTLLLFGIDRIEEAIEMPSMVPDSMNLLELFMRMLKQKRGIALVIDEFGAPIGSVTLEQILESVITGFHTSHEHPDLGFQKAGPNRWHVSGSARLDAFRRERPSFPDSDEVETLAGLILLQSEVIPPPGSVFHIGGHRLQVIESDRRHIRSLHVEVDHS